MIRLHKEPSHCDVKTHILLDFSLTVKAATLIFISGRGLTIFHLLRKENQVLFIIW